MSHYVGYKQKTRPYQKYSLVVRSQLNQGTRTGTWNMEQEQGTRTGNMEQEQGTRTGTGNKNRNMEQGARTGTWNRNMEQEHGHVLTSIHSQH